MSNPRILIVGGGALGTVLAAHLFEVGAVVHLLEPDPTLRTALAARGARVESLGERLLARLPVWALPPVHEPPFDFVILATQPSDAVSAALACRPCLGDQGVVICAQAGLCESRVADALGTPTRVAGLVAALGISAVEPGYARRTAAGGVLLGFNDPDLDPAALAPLATCLEALAEVQLTCNLLGARLSQLALHCAVSPLTTLGDAPLGILVRESQVRRLALEAITEAVAVARLEGIELVTVPGTVDPARLSLPELDATSAVALAAKHGLLAAVALRYRHQRSSWTHLLKASKCPPVDWINGELIRRAAAHRFPVPINQALWGRVMAVSRGELKVGRGLLSALYESTRAPG